MRRVPVAIALAALVLLAGLAMATGSSASKKPQFVATTAPVTFATLVCPDISGTPSGTTSRAAAADVSGALSPPSQSAGTVTSTVLAGAKSKTTTLHLAPAAMVPNAAKTDQTIDLAAAGSVAASLAGDQVTETPTGRDRALSGVRCEAPATDWWFAGADGRVGFSDVLTMANPAPTPAEVSISLWGAKGAVVTTRLQSLRINARSTMKIPIATVAPDVATITVHVHATSGAVTAALFDRRSSALNSNGGDFMPATQPPARSAVVAGFAPGHGARYLIIADPGSNDATVSLRLVTQSGSFVPVGENQVVVRAGHSRAVDLAAALGGTTGAVELSSDQPIVAQGLSVSLAPPKRPDLMWLAATAPIAGPAAIADGREPDGGHTLLYLTAPQAAAQVTVSTPSGATKTISVPAGRSIATDITSTVKAASGPWPFVVTPVGSAPVYGVRVLTFTGAHGALITGEPLVGLPKPITLPPVREDPGVATRR
jgi:hypothetical protein